MLLMCLDLCRTLPKNTKCFARVATNLQMQGVSTDIPPESVASAPVDAMVIQFVIEGFLRGWGLSGSNVSLGHGTALFSTRLDVDQWNEACLQQIEHMNTDDLEGVDIVASKLSTATNVKTLPARVRRAGPRLRGVEKLPLQTSPLHRMRLMLLSNINVDACWATGTRVSLLPSGSWTPPHRTCRMRKNSPLDTLHPDLRRKARRHAPMTCGVCLTLFTDISRCALSRTLQRRQHRRNCCPSQSLKQYRQKLRRLA